MEKIIGYYSSCQTETYAECARITLYNKVEGWIFEESGLNKEEFEEEDV